LFTPRIADALAYIEEADRRQKESGQGLPFWRVSADNGRLLHILCRVSGAKRAVELGTSSGYSGIHIASALASTGGHLWTFEREPAKIAMAGENFERAGLTAQVTIVAGDILQTLPAFVAASAEPLDFVFLDAVKSDYVRYLEIVRPRLRCGSVVCADNVGRRHADAVRAYLEAVGRAPFLTSMVPTLNAEGEQDALAVSLVQA
jgi:predicted O-methyltransferase YrrM